MKLVNLTPQPIFLRMRRFCDNRSASTLYRDVKIEPSGTIARLKIKDLKLGQISIPQPFYWPDGGWIDLAEREYGEIEGLPEREVGTIYIVSTPVAQRAAQLGRRDVYALDYRKEIRDENGKLVAVGGLVRFRSTSKVRHFAAGEANVVATSK